MTRIFGLCAGPPFGASSYSGSSGQLFRALERRGVLVGAEDVDGGRPDRRLAVIRTILATRKVRGRKPLARWTAGEILQRSRRAEALLARARAGGEVTAALMYGTDYFPALRGQSPVVPVGAALDTTFAQLARSGEAWFGHLTPGEVERSVRGQREVFDRCAWLFPRTEWCAESLVEDYDVPRSKIVVTGAGPNLQRLPAERPASGAHDLRTILFVGRDWYRKNGPLVLDAFRLAHRVRPDLRLVVVGPASFEHRAPGVEWRGALDGDAREELIKLYERASLVLLPSRFEPFGIAVLEALVAGCPVVALDHGAARELIEDGVTGSLLETPEPRALAEVMLHWLGDAERLAAAGRAGRAGVLRDYSWDLAAERVAGALGGAGGAGSPPSESPSEP